MKVVYNSCYGGFSVSDAAIRRYAEIKGITLYPEVDKTFGRRFTTYWTIPETMRVGRVLEGDAWKKATLEERKASNAFCDANVISNYRLERTDPVLVQVVEELGADANGAHAELVIEDVPAGKAYRIQEYDGNEWIEYRDEIEWKVG